MCPRFKEISNVWFQNSGIMLHKLTEALSQGTPVMCKETLTHISCDTCCRYLATPLANAWGVSDRVRLKAEPNHVLENFFCNRTRAPSQVCLKEHFKKKRVVCCSHSYPRRPSQFYWGFFVQFFFAALFFPYVGINL